MYEPLEVVKCEKCGKVIAEPKEPIESQNSNLNGHKYINRELSLWKRKLAK